VTRRAGTVWLLCPRPQAEALAFLLEEEGLSPVFVPLLDAEAPEDGRALASAAEQLGRFQWVAPDAPQAVRALLENVRAAGTRASLDRVRWLCVDADTARAVERSGFASQVAAPGRPDAWAGLVAEEDEILALHEAAAAPAWVGQLGSSITTVRAWRRRPTVALDAVTPPDVVVVHSPVEGEALAQALPSGRLAAWRFVAAGPATAGVLKELGAGVCVVATTPAADGVLDATLRALSE
jgi:uroporphyrinogen-III synthase